MTNYKYFFKNMSLQSWFIDNSLTNMSCYRAFLQQGGDTTDELKRIQNILLSDMDIVFQRIPVFKELYNADTSLSDTVLDFLRNSEMDFLRNPESDAVCIMADIVTNSAKDDVFDSDLLYYANFMKDSYYVNAMIDRAFSLAEPIKNIILDTELIDPKYMVIGNVVKLATLGILITMPDTFMFDTALCDPNDLIKAVDNNLPIFNLKTRVYNNDDILHFTKVTKLNISENVYITDVNGLSELTELYLYESICKLIHTGFEKCTNINKLDIRDNTHVTDINCLGKNLTYLDASGIRCVMTQQGMNACTNIKTLKISRNREIYNLNHIGANLTHLDASRTCNLRQIGISACTNIVKLNISGTNSITDLNHMAESLTELEANGSNCGLTQNGISMCTKIVKLKIIHNKNIYDVNHMKDTLTELNAHGYTCSLDQEGITECTKISKLVIIDNSEITDVNHMAASLTSLDARGELCGLTQEGISMCKNLITLNVYNNMKIKNI